MQYESELWTDSMTKYEINNMWHFCYYFQYTDE